MNSERCKHLFGSSRIARLATTGPDGPHVVPVVFAVEGDRIFTAIDHKPKTTRNLQRLRNIERSSTVSVLTDHYDEDWGQLWWVRADGTATIEHGLSGSCHGVDLLVERYPQYADRRPDGPLITVEVENWSGWAAS